MIKRLFLTICMVFICSMAFAEEHYIYIRTYDRPGVTAEDDAGRSKEGDIVDIRYADYELSEAEKSEWAIVTASGLTKEDILKYKQSWEIQTGVDREGHPVMASKSYRKYKVKKSFTKDLRKGEKAEKVDSLTIKGHIRIKTDTDLIAYEQKRKVYAFFQPARQAYKYVKYAFEYWTLPAYALTLDTCGSATADREVVCTINKSGQDYDTLTLWEDAVDGDLVTAQQIQTSECYDDDGDLSDNLTIAGSTTNATYYMNVTSPVGERHDGTEGSGFALTDGGSGWIITVDDDNIIIDWLEIKNIGFNDYAIGSTTDSNLTVRNNIIHDGFNLYLISYSATTGAVHNNIFYDDNGSASRCISLFNASSSTLAYNNTAYNCGTGIYTNSSPMIKNNIAVGNSTDFTFATSTHDYNVSEDATATGTNSLTTGSDSDFVSVSGGSEDFHLASGAVEIDEGVDLGSTYEIDIDGVARSGTWDIGADEFVSAAPTFTATITIR